MINQQKFQNIPQMNKTATTRTTRKYANIISNPKVAMVIDNRSNREADFQKANAVTVTGKAREIKGSVPMKRQGRS